MKAIRIPTGSSKGANSVLPSKSQSRTKLAPNRALQGSRKRASFPKRCLHICGTINPTNPRSPAKLTTHPARTLEISKSMKRVTPTCSPSERAMSSPSPRIFSGFARNRDTKKASNIQQAGRASLLKVRPDKEPIMKEVMFTVISVSRSLTVLIPALKKLDTVIPARIIVVRELSARYARKKMASVVKRAPTNAKTGMVVIFPGKISMDNITAKPAPEFTPMVLGLAKELFITPCKITPEQASPTPASSPANTRGILTVVINRYVVDVGSKMSVSCMGTLPNKSPANTQAISSKIKNRIVMTLFFIGRNLPY